MSVDAEIGLATPAQRYEAVFGISEAISACRQPEELVTTLAEKLDQLVHFDNLYLVVLKENSTEIEYLISAKGPQRLPDLPVKELPGWDAFESRVPLHVADWNAEQRFPRFKDWATKKGIKLGSGVRIPLTTPHRRLGVLGIIGDTVKPYSAEDISFLRLIGREVAFVLDDSLNLKRAQNAQASSQHHNDRLQLLLNLTNRITSNLELREVLRAIAADIREVMQCDAVAFFLVDGALGEAGLYALDFPRGKGFIREEDILTVPLTGTGKRVLETLKPAISNRLDPADVPVEIRDRVIAEGVRSRCWIPLVHRGRAVGVLTIARITEASFPPEDIQFLSQASGSIAIAIENALAYREISDLRDKLAQEKLYLQEEIRSEMGFEQIIGNSTGLKHVLELVDTVAPNDSTVLLLGETGTGKELIARAVHEHSRRKDRTFVKLNCAAIPTGLLESELFGHEKGAFTGAISAKIGRLDLADQGTLFLDEVGDIPLEIQPKLLRVLQEQEFERLGSTRTRKVNVRLIAATNRELEKMVASREFRSDLYYRLNVFPIRIPALRDRKDDIPLLVTYFVQKFAKQMQKNIEAIPVAVMRVLTAWNWPGNIRELENFIERAVILTRTKSLEAPLSELREPLANPAPHGPRESAASQDVAAIVRETIQSLEKMRSTKPRSDAAENQRQEIMRVLRETNGRVGGADGAAARMGINRTTLVSRMRRFGIHARQYV